MSQRNDAILDAPSTSSGISGSVPNDTTGCGGSDDNNSVGKSSCSSTLSLDDVACRICFRGCTDEPLAQTCHCKGSIGLVHKSCLERWVSQRRRSRCDICGYRYKVQCVRKSYLQLLEDKEARREPLSHLLKALALLLTILVLMPLSCAYVAAMHFSIYSVTLFVFLTGHSMFWFRRPAIYFLEFLRLAKEWRRKSASVRIIIPQPYIHPRPTKISQLENSIRRQRITYNFLIGTLVMCNFAFSLPLAVLYILEIKDTLQTLVVYYLFIILITVSISWLVSGFLFFYAAYRSLCTLLEQDNSPQSSGFWGWLTRHKKDVATTAATIESTHLTSTINFVQDNNGI